MRLSPTKGLLHLLSLLSIGSLHTNFANALTLDYTSVDSVKEVASQIAYGSMKYYTGNRTGDVPGNLPAPYYWWEAGALFGQMIQYWYYTGDSQYNAETKQAMLHQIGADDDYMPANQSKSLGNDDQVFWAFAAMDAAELNFTNPDDSYPSWLALAQAVFNEQAGRWDTTSCGGGIRWQIYTFNAGYDYKNTITNGGFFQLAARLARYTNNDTYTEWANKLWDWQEGTPLLDATNWLVNDGSSTLKNCTDASQVAWTYNYGTFIAGCAYLYNHTQEEKWLTRFDGLLNTTLAKFFPTSMGDKIMVEIACEPKGNCNTDQPAFKSFLGRWLAVGAQLIPDRYERIFAYLRASAVGAAGQCSGGTDGITCGREWNTTTWDGTYGIGEQMSALGVVQAMMMDVSSLPAPYSKDTGGTSEGNPSAGTGSSSSGSSGSGGSSSSQVATRTITVGDKAGAGIVTAFLLMLLLSGGFWMLTG